MQTSAVFPTTPRRAGMYESFYLRAVAPDAPLGAWLRYTVHKAPKSQARGSLWCTLFDARRGRPFMHKLTSSALTVPPGGWIAIDDSSLGPDHAEGRCGPASWSLRFQSRERALEHLPSAWMYRARLPRTKLSSPAPDASFRGTIELDGGPRLQLEGWRGMVGHNWGSEHAERWIWLHGIDFTEARDAWLDVALGRIKVAGRTTPWVANGAFSRDGARTRLGGLAIRRLSVSESPRGCLLALPGEHGARIRARVEVPAESAAGWLYADPDGGEHEVVNCSVARLELEVTRPGERTSSRLISEHGGAYELGTRAGEAHGVPIAPFADG